MAQALCDFLVGGGDFDEPAPNPGGGQLFAEHLAMGSFAEGCVEDRARVVVGASMARSIKVA